MAQEAILNVSLKDYKKNIDELRASLLGLEKDSEDYKRIAEELKDKQDKLNEVMSVGKESVNALDGSYNQLSATLSQLKKEWKNMEMGTPEWEAMAVRIDEINNQLKDADASVGVFTRNVGDYANAFEEAFKQAAGGLSSMPGVIGSIASTTKQLIPLVQKASTAATVGLKGVKKALVSTGIGALIVAVGMLIAHFDDLMKLFKKNNPAEDAQKAFDALKKSIDAQNDSLELETQLMEAAGATSEEVRLKKVELIKAQQAQTLAQLENVRATIKQIEAHSKFRQWITGEKKDLESLRETEQELFNLEASQSKEITKLLNSNTADRIKEKKKAADEEKKQLDDLLKKVKENSKSEIQALTDKYNEELALLKKYGKDTTELTKQYNEKIKAINESGIDSAYSRLGQFEPVEQAWREYQKLFKQVMKWQEAVDKEFPPESMLETNQVTAEMIKKAKELKLVVGNTKEEFVTAWRAAYLEFEQGGKNLIENQFALTREGQEYLETLQAEGKTMEYLNQVADDAFGRLNLFQKLADDISTKLTKIANGTFDYAKEGFKTLEDAETYYINLLEYADKAVQAFSRDWKHASADVINYTNSLKQVQTEMGLLEKEFGYTKPKGYHEAIKNLEDYYKQYIALVKEKEEEAAYIEFENEEQRKTYLYLLEEHKIKKLEWFEQERERIEEEYQGKSNAWQWFSNTSRFYEIYDARLKAAEWYRDNLEIIEGETNEEREKRELEAEQAILKIKREYAQKHIEVSQTLNNDLLSVWDSLINIRESKLKQEENAEVKSLRQRLKSQGKGEREINEEVDKVRDEYGRKAFEESKKSKISLGWVETIQGALAAFMGYQDFPQPYGAILGAAAAATTMAAGIAQIEAIKASEYGVSSNSSNPVAVVNATPRLADYSPDTVTNLTGASEVDSLKNALQETPIYVSVTDINNAQAKVTDRDKESSF